uniref:Uncharacterized protein n=1 Tax=Arundo donax TaxID=35708 RepID=A0A0A8ZZ42_ARUDO
MVNHIRCWLAPSAQAWFIKLPLNSIDSQRELCDLFIFNFWATYKRPGTKWDLY